MSNHTEIQGLDVGTRVGLNDTGGPTWSSRFGTDNIIDGVVCRDNGGQNYVIPLNAHNMRELACAVGRGTGLSGGSLQKYAVEPDQMVTAKWREFS